jgi:UDP-N-acetylmuramoylalanine--D-glutamate ligase
MDKKQLITPGQTVCVIGLGVTGKSAVRYCLSRGAKVCVSDARAGDVLLHEEADFLKDNDVEWEAGGHTFDFLSKSDLLLPSPGIDLRTPFFRSLTDSGIDIAGELEVMAGEMDVPVVAVTGTNGKTTVTSLIGEVLTGAGKRVFVGGNIGTPLYEYCLTGDQYDVVVVEVSSFQLECSGSFAPDIAILLNITPDHLDRHGTIEGYIAAKGRIFASQESEALAIINGDDQLCQKIQVPKNVKKEQFGRLENCFLEISDGKFTVHSAREFPEDSEEFSFSLNGLGGFSLYNYGAAFLALIRLGLSPIEIEIGFQEFNNLPHRLEYVAKVNGIIFVNDSKATNTGAVIGALEQIKDDVVLIAGGRDKGDDFNLLRRSVDDKVRGLVLIGESAGMIEESLDDLVECTRALTMEDAVAKAYSMAREGDTVLLSPACASFDMFSSYGNRGDIFKAAAMILVEKELSNPGNQKK